MTGPAPMTPIRHGQYGAPSSIWRYADAAGATVGWVCRFDLPEGGKQVIPCVPAGDGIRWVSFDKPRQLYGLELLGAHPNAQILIVEGEKAADAARRIVPVGILVLTWPGGCKAVKHADWYPLAGRQVILWPDADAKVDKQTGRMKPLHEQGGTAAMLQLAEILQQIASKVRIVRLPDPGDGFPDGWDLADAEVEGWDSGRVLDYIRTHLAKPQDLLPPAPAGPTLEELEAMAEADRQRDRAEREAIDGPADDQHGQPDSLDQASEPEEDDVLPFKMLGHDHGTYYYLPAGSRQVTALTAAGHTQNNMLMLASLGWWERRFQGKKGPDWNSAVDFCIQGQHRVGIFDVDRVRGRGAWWDDKRPVLHCGDQLIVNGIPLGVDQLSSRFIYENSKPMHLAIVDPLSNSDANRFVRLCETFSWTRPISGRLLAGWCVLAPICGAMAWRPHVWITARSGGGKSWITTNVVKAILGDFMLDVGRDTSEAGIRQNLVCDSIPVVFDEGGDGSSRAAKQRIEQVLSLMRGSSSETGAKQAKGTVTGKPQSYKIRSSFLMASVATGMKDHADVNRITVLELDAPKLTFEEIQAAVSELLTDDYVDRFRYRTVTLIPVIRENARTFARAGATIGGTQRFGDQIGALLAGCYSLFSDKLITLEAAKEWIEKQDWAEEREATEKPDEDGLLSAILQHIVRLDGGENRAVGELVAMVVDGADFMRDGRLTTATDAYNTLLRMGIRVETQYVKICYGSNAIERILQDTPWSNGWTRVLGRLPGAQRLPAMRFGKWMKDRAVSLPVELVVGK